MKEEKGSRETICFPWLHLLMPSKARKSQDPKSPGEEVSFINFDSSFEGEKLTTKLGGVKKRYRLGTRGAFCGQLNLSHNVLWVLFQRAALMHEDGVTAAILRI